MVMISRPQFNLNCEDVLAPQGEWLADCISSLNDQGNTLREGVTMQIGWSVLKLINRNGALWLCEPNFSGNPFVDFRPDTSATLRVLFSKNEIGRRPSVVLLERRSY